MAAPVAVAGTQGAIATAIGANAAGTTYTLAPYTYFGAFSPQAGDIFIGDPSGKTIISGALTIPTWSGSGSTWKATQYNNGAGATNIPAMATSWVGTGYLAAGVFHVSTTTSGAVTQFTTLFDSTGGVTAGTQINSGSASTWNITGSQTLGSVGSPVALSATPNVGFVAYTNPMAPQLEDLFVNGVKYSRVAAPGPAGANTWWWNQSDHSINVNSNLTAATVYYAQVPTAINSSVSNVTLANMTFQHFAPGSGAGALEIVNNNGWEIYNVNLLANHGNGANFYQSSNVTVRGGKWQNNGFLSSNPNASPNFQMTGTDVSSNNTAGYDPGWAAANIKLSGIDNFILRRVVSKNCPAGQGIWIDSGSSNGTVTECIVTGNNGAGIMYEVSFGQTIISYNVCSDNAGPQIYISNASDCDVFENLCKVKSTNSPSNPSGSPMNGGIVLMNDVRGNWSPTGLPYTTDRCQIHDNTIIHQGDTGRDGFEIVQAITNTNTWTNNIYYVADMTIQYWQDTFTGYSLAGWQGLGRDAGSQVLTTPFLTVAAALALFADGGGAGNIVPSKIRQLVNATLNGPIIPTVV